jgi:hypothetical protein
VFTGKVWENKWNVKRTIVCSPASAKKELALLWELLWFSGRVRENNLKDKKYLKFIPQPRQRENRLYFERYYGLGVGCEKIVLK